MNVCRRRAPKCLQGLSVVLAAITLAACSTMTEPEEEITYSPTWFACKSRFSCVVVQDAFCALKAVNSKSAIVYQDWSRQEVIRQEERIVCPRPEELNAVAGCVQGRCVYPFSRKDFSRDSR